jgi:hypothetical protein
MTPSPAADANGSVAVSRRHTVRLVSRAVDSRTPLAVVRFGEGEGRLLAADPGDDFSIRVAGRKLHKQTGLAFPPGEVLKVRALVTNALDQADIVGLRGSARFSDEHREWMDLINRIYAERVVGGRRPAYVAHCLLHHDVYDALPDLLGQERQLSVISCRDLGPKLKADYGIADPAVYQIPSQYVVRDVDDEYEARLHDVDIWPDFYRELRSGIEVRERGEIFLVGAGLFGKDLCIRVRDLGGIALDMGSTLDQMAGKVTRGHNRPQFRPPPETPRWV